MCNCFNIISGPDQFMETNNHKKEALGQKHSVEILYVIIDGMGWGIQDKESRGNTLNLVHDILLL